MLLSLLATVCLLRVVYTAKILSKHNMATINLKPNFMMVLHFFFIKEESTNDFELKETIGHGATGTVWKAAWKSKNIMVAVKRIQAGEISANTKREVKALFAVH